MNCTDEQGTRYSRHIFLPQVGGKGQKRIAQARILIVGGAGSKATGALIDLGDAPRLTGCWIWTRTLWYFERSPSNVIPLRPLCGDHPTVTERIDHEQAVCELRASVSAAQGIHRHHVTIRRQSRFLTSWKGQANE